MSFSPKETWRAVRSAGGGLKGIEYPGIPSTELTRARAAADGVSPKGYYVTANRRVQRKDYTNKKKQVPSWCDRILTRSLAAVSLTQENYLACDEMVCSDHSPVSASFAMSIPRLPPPSSMFLVCVMQLEEVRFVMKIGAASKRPKAKQAGADKKKYSTRWMLEDTKNEVAAIQGKIARHPSLALSVQSSIFVDATKFSHVNSKAAKRELGGPRSRLSAAATKQMQYEWKPHMLPTIGPFLTTREYIREQVVLLHAVPTVSSSPARKLASCHVPLAQALADSGMYFEANAQHQGIDIGKISGKVRVAYQPLSWSPSRRSHVLNAFKLSSKMRRLAKLPRSSARYDIPAHESVGSTDFAMHLAAGLKQRRGDSPRDVNSIELTAFHSSTASLPIPTASSYSTLACRSSAADDADDDDDGISPPAKRFSGRFAGL